MLSDDNTLNVAHDTFAMIKTFLIQYGDREEIIDGLVERGHDIDGMDYLTDEELADHIAHTIVYGPAET